MKCKYYEESEIAIAIAKDDINFNISGVKEGTQYWDEVQDWVAEGNVISPYVAPTPPVDNRTDLQKLEDATGLTEAQIKAALGV